MAQDYTTAVLELRFPSDPSSLRLPSLISYDFLQLSPTCEKLEMEN